MNGHEYLTPPPAPRVVLCNGCFDVLHWGHLVHLYAAKTQGSHLVVALTSDRYVREQKGAGHPVFDQDKRAAMLRELRCVDDVVISDAPTCELLIRRWSPVIYCKGIEYQGRLPEQVLVESLGGRVVFTDTPKFSSTALMGRV